MGTKQAPLSSVPVSDPAGHHPTGQTALMFYQMTVSWPRGTRAQALNPARSLSGYRLACSPTCDPERGLVAGREEAVRHSNSSPTTQRGCRQKLQ